MKIVEVAYFTSKEYDVWLGRRGDGSLVMEGFAKDGDELKYLVYTPKDASIGTALESLKRYGRRVQRPYLLGGSCDGSITTPVLALYLDFCQQHKLDASSLYAKVYPGEGGLEEEAITTFADWQGVRIPYRWTAACFEGLLESLTKINYHTLRSILKGAAKGVTFSTGALERGGYVAFRGNTRTYSPTARFTWGHVVTPTGEHYWRYDPWPSKNGFVPKHYWLSFIAVAASQDGNLELERRVIEEALRVARSPANRAHYAWWLGLWASRQLENLCKNLIRRSHAQIQSRRYPDRHRRNRSPGSCRERRAQKRGSPP